MNVFASIPRYVLKDGLNAIGPTNRDTDNDEAASVIYGFSDKPEYDLFRSQDSRLLKPYPLVARFLLDELSHGSVLQQLIVLNAVSPKQDTVVAAGMRAILNAFNEKLDQVEATHELTLDKSAEIYRIKRIHDNQCLSTLH